MHTNRIISWSIRVVLATLLLGRSSAADPRSLYEHALSIIDSLPPAYSSVDPVFTGKNIQNYLYIPQYNASKQDYEHYDPYKVQLQDQFPGLHHLLSWLGLSPWADSTNSEPPHIPSTQFQEQVLPLLEQAADHGHAQSMVTLADVFMFGNYSTPTNYTRAHQLYQKSVSIQPNGHAYFMLGFIYSTGLFGEVPIDERRANLYYQFGADNDNIQAMLVLAHKYSTGVGKFTDCGMSRHYYMRLAHLGTQHMLRNNLAVDSHETIYNIPLVDFKGGIYGSKLSESQLSLSQAYYASSKNLFNENNLDIHDHDYVDYYFTALEYYHGDYFIDQNLTLAFEVAQECVKLAETRYGSKNYLHVNAIDRFFISNCQIIYAKMLLNGHGTEVNYDSAYRWFLTASKIGVKPVDAHIHLGKIRSMDPLTDGVQSSAAIAHWGKALELQSPRAAINIANAHLRESPEGDILGTSDPEYTYNLIKESAYGGNAEAMYQLINIIEAGVADKIGKAKYTCQMQVTLAQRYIEELEGFFYPQLKYAFEEFRYGHFKNALLGYSLAAEQGLKNAELSAAYLLYQLEPFIPIQGKKTFSPARMNMAIRYLERASAHDNVDATILLGDIYFYGVESANITSDYNKAFAYYNTAASSQPALSSHACFNLGYMYEYGLGPTNNSVDHFLAKRYYDLSLERKDTLHRLSKQSPEKATDKFNTVPINLALLRLRLKFLFNKKKYSNRSSNGDASSSGWLNAFKKLTDNNDKENEVVQSQDNSDNSNQKSKAQAHHEGGSYFVDEEYETADYLVFFFTIMFFGIFFVQNVYRQMRRLAQRRNNQNQNENDNGEPLPDQQPDERLRPPNRNAFNFEFHFVAL